MTLQEIRQGIIQLLRSGTDVQFITGEDVSQAKELPLLHVQLEPLSFQTAAAGYFSEKTILVDISYMEELHTSNTGMYEMLERIDRVFRPFFRIGDRFFTPDAQLNITDDIGHYTFTLHFYDAEEFDSGPLMEELAVKFKKEEKTDGITGNTD